MIPKLHATVECRGVLVPPSAWKRWKAVLCDGLMGYPITITHFFQDPRGEWYPIWHRTRKGEPTHDNIIPFPRRVA